MIPTVYEGEQAYRYGIAGRQLAASADRWDAIVCPNCRGRLTRRSDGAVCVDCGDEYPLATLLWYRLGSLVVGHEKANETYRRLNAAADFPSVARGSDEAAQESRPSVAPPSRERDDERTDAGEARR